MGLQGDVWKTWLKRWLVLGGVSFAYFPDGEMKKTVREVSMDEVVKISPDPDKPKRFVVACWRRRHGFIIEASSDQEARDWRVKFDLALMRYQAVRKALTAKQAGDVRFVCEASSAPFLICGWTEVAEREGGCVCGHPRFFVQLTWIVTRASSSAFSFHGLLSFCMSVMMSS